MNTFVDGKKFIGQLNKAYTGKACFCKVITLMIICIAMIANCACSNKKVSNLTIPSLKSNLPDGLVSNFVRTEVENGYEFKCETSDYIYDCSCVVITNSKEKISSITFINKNIDTSMLTYSGILTLLNKRDFNVKELRVCMCIQEIMSLEDTFERDLDNVTVVDWCTEIASLFQGEKISVKKWTIESTVDQSGEQVSIHAYYNG